MATKLESALRVVKPGDQVVSISEILNQLGNKLTVDEKEKLLIAILSRRKEQVQPGDLITADLINQILADIADLEVRLTRLENQQPIKDTDVTIQQLLPSGDLTVGDEIAIVGRNFEFSIGAAYVSFGKKSVFAFKSGSRDDRLITSVPDLGELPSEGTKVPLTVSNRTSSDFRMVTVSPAQIPLYGNVLVVPGTVEPNPPQTSKDTLFPHTVTSAASREAAFKISVLLGGAGEQPDDAKYDHLVSILNKDKQPILKRTVELAPNTSELIYIKISQLPFTGTFSIVVTASALGVKGDAGLKSYTVGEEDTNDDLLTLEPPTYTPDTAVSGGVVTLKVNANVKASMTLKLSDKAIAGGMTAAICDFSLDLTDGTGWSLLLLDPTPDQGSATKASEIEIRKDAPRIVEFAIVAKPNPSQSGSTQLTVVRGGQTGGTQKEKSFGLRLKATE